MWRSAQSYFNISLVLVMTFASTSWGSPTITVPPSESGSYTIQGSGMDGVAGIQIDITYDKTSLSTPTVTQGSLVSGAMLAANTSVPGSIRIAIISTNSFSGSGPIATVSFASKTGSGGITSITTSMIDSKGSAIAASAGTASTETTALSSTPGVPFSQPSSPSRQNTTPATPITTAATTTPSYPGTVTLPTDYQQHPDAQAIPSPSLPATSGEVAPSRIEEQSKPADKPGPDTASAGTAQYVVYKGVLDRFRQHTGSKQLSVMAALFDKRVAQTIVQEPAIIITDGQNKVTLTVDLPARISTSPNFAVNSGALLSFRQDKQAKGRWIVEILPEAGSNKVLLTIIAGTEEFEFPLTAAMPLKTALPLDERGWNAFITEVGTAAAPQHDFNNDGTRDHADEFIFVANFLAAKRPTPTKPTAPAKNSGK